MALTCTSTANNFAVTDTFTVRIEDACLTTSFIWPSYETMDVDLFTTGTAIVPLADTTVVGCAPIT